jgi:hypothetical protein
LESRRILGGPDGGLLLLIAIISLLPGRMHGIVGKLLRWPVLGVTYFMIGVELSVYIVIRIFIRIIETTFANSKHRRLRNSMRNAHSYAEWYKVCLRTRRIPKGELIGVK